MSPDREQRLEQIFSAARNLRPPERAAFLDQACGNDAELRQEAEYLLAAHDQAGAFLQPTITVVPPDGPSEQPSDRIGRYKLLEKVGEGGFGVVWMAEQEEPVRRRVALKIIKLGMDTKEVVARFEAERQALAMMDHPNIASVYDGGATDTGRPYFVMELVKGVPLMDFCDERRLSTRERLDLFLQVCHAVQHAHQKGVIHRDLKPSNVLVTVQDDRPVPKVIDFGIAKATQARLTEKTLFTRLQQWVGTPAYMSPEQAGLGSLDVDTRSDVYSLGVLLYELLTGRTPFDTQKLLASGYDAVMRSIREEEPPKPSTRLSTLAREELNAVAARRAAEPTNLNRLVRGDLDWIVMKALEKDRVRRYETVNALALDIQRHLENEPVQARPPSSLYRLQKMVRRNKVLFATGSLVSASLVFGLGISTILLFKEKAARERAVAAEQQAEDARAREALQSLKATAKAQESLDRLLRLQNANGIGWMDEDELAASLPWFVEALSQQQGRPEREELQRIRINSVLGECAKMVQMWFHAGPVSSAHFNRNGRLVVTASRDYTARLWDVGTGKSIGDVLQHAGIVWQAVFSPDGRRVVTASEDGTARVWDAESGQPLTKPLRHEGPVVSAVFSPDGRLMATASEDHTARLWDAESGVEVAVIRAHGDAVRHVIFSPDSRLLATGSDDARVRIWQTTVAGKVSPAVLLYSGPLTALRFNAAGNHFLASSLDASVRNHVVAQGYPYLHPTINYAGPVLHCCFSPDDRYLVTTLGTGAGRVYDALSGEPKSPELLHRGAIHWAEFDAESRRVVTASADQTASIWEVSTGEPAVRLRHGGAVRMAEFSPDGRFVLTASDDGIARIWLLPASRPLYRRVQDDPPLWNGVAGPDGVIRVLRDTRQTGAVTIEGVLPADSPGRRIQHAGIIRSVAFSPDGRRLATGSDDQTARIWSTDTGQPVSPPLEHRAPVWRLAFSPNGRLLATATAGRSIRIWDASTGEPLTPNLRRDGPITNLVFSPDGGRLVASGEGGSSQSWALTPTQLSIQDLSSLAELLAGRQLDDTKTSLEPSSTDRMKGLWDSLGKKYLPALVAEAAKENESAQPSDKTSVAIPSRDPSTGPNQLDLSLFYNALLTQGWQTPEEERLTGNDLSELPRGLVEFGGINFDVRGIIQVSGQSMKAQGGRYPEQIKGIPVQRKCDRLHFLNGTGWSTPEGVEIGAYVIHYANGQRRVIPIRYGRDVRDWFFFQSLPITSRESRVVWVGANARTRANGNARLQLYLRTWTNPAPELEIKSIDFISAMTACAPFVIAITVDELPGRDSGAPSQQGRPEGKARDFQSAIGVCTAEGRFSEGLALIEDRLETERAELGARDPQTLQTLRALVDFSGRVGDWNGCVTNARTFMELSGYDALVARACAAAALLAGNQKTYREVCLRMIAEHGNTTDPVVAERTAKVCLLAPGALPDLQPALTLAELAVRSQTNDFWFRLVKGMAEFRSDHPELALQWLNPVVAGHELHAAILAGYFTCLAHQHLKQVEQARTGLTNANDRLDAFLQQGLLSEPGWEQWWFDPAACLVLRSEAEKMVLAKEVSPVPSLTTFSSARKAWWIRQAKAASIPDVGKQLKLADKYLEDAGPSFDNPDGNRAAAREALGCLERVWQQWEKGGQSTNWSAVWTIRGDLTRAAFWAGDYSQARQYARDWLKASEELEKEPLPLAHNESIFRKRARGQTIHDANMILGEIALSEGKIKDAAKFLIEAGKATDGLTLTSYGPDLALTNDLLEQGEREAVLTFFQECRAFWKTGEDRLNQWIKAIQNEQKPDFGPGFHFHFRRVQR